MNGSGDPRVVRLLGAIAALLGVLVLGLGIATALAWRGVAQLRGELTGRGDVVKELAARQQEASRQLAAMVGDARRQIAQFEARAAELRRRGNGPLETPARMAEMQQLMVDQMNLALKQATGMQDVLAKGSRPAGDASGPSEAPRATPEEPARSARRPANARPRESTPPTDAPPSATR
jgi:hypothetical protein